MSDTTTTQTSPDQTPTPPRKRHRVRNGLLILAALGTIGGIASAAGGSSHPAAASAPSATSQPATSAPATKAPTPAAPASSAPAQQAPAAPAKPAKPAGHRVPAAGAGLGPVLPRPGLRFQQAGPDRPARQSVRRQVLRG